MEIAIACRRQKQAVKLSALSQLVASISTLVLFPDQTRVGLSVWECVHTLVFIHSTLIY